MTTESAALDAPRDGYDKKFLETCIDAPALNLNPPIRLRPPLDSGFRGADSFLGMERIPASLPGSFHGVFLLAPVG